MLESLSFGVSLPNRAVLFGMPSETLFSLATQAEESGLFESVWVGDNFLSKPRLEAVVLLAALAARTSRLKLGTVCLATFPMRNPIQFAIQWASLDVVSGGRTVLAVCNGESARAGPQFAAEYATMGIGNDERVARLEEGIQLIRELWAHDEVTFRGRFYRTDKVSVEPKPIQERVPIVIAANPAEARDAATRDRIIQRVATLADGWQTDGLSPMAFAEYWNLIRERAREVGREDAVSHASLHLMVNINEDRGRARQEAVEFLDRYYGVGRISDDKIRDWLAFGPPEAVAGRIREFVEAGCTTPILRFAARDPLAQLRRCTEEVLPAVMKPTVGRS
jgi:alkanesulfonate monooxygenase SsuD/methylene tetrahydromethanopterin reductase-like flavin-dependent oxidoreductase (luciferase family)